VNLVPEAEPVKRVADPESTGNIVEDSTPITKHTFHKFTMRTLVFGFAGSISSTRRSPLCLNLRIYEKTAEEDNCPDVVVDKEESAHEEDMHEEKSAHACPKGSGSGKPSWSLFSHIGHSFGAIHSTLYSLLFILFLHAAFPLLLPKTEFSFVFGSLCVCRLWLVFVHS